MTRLVVAVVLLLGSATTAGARLFLSRKEALALAFPPGIEVVRKTAYLDEAQVGTAEKSAHAKVDSMIWTYYVGRSSGGVVGYAYFDRTVVRTLPATVMAALDAEGRMRFIEILSFDEPEDYLPRKRWLDLFKGKDLDTQLRLRGDIPNVSGATLTSEALTRSARRMAAIHRVLHTPAKEKK